MNPLRRFRDGERGFDEPIAGFEISLLVVVGLLLAVTAPLVQSVEAFWLVILTRVLIFAMFALSLDLAFGFAGLLSLGHAAMFGTGGYVAGLMLVHLTPNILAILLVAVLGGFIVAALIGALSVRSSGVYFAMLTLAFAQILYIAVFNDVPATLTSMETVTGGDNGLIIIQDYEFFGFELAEDIVYYYLTLAFLALAVLLVIRLTNSPFGRAVQGIRENETRARFIGYNPERYQLLMFTVSGGLAALAGALYVPFLGIGTPTLLHWSTSGEVVLMVLIGGIGTVWGPMLGAVFFLILEEFLSGVEGWEILLGVSMIAVVIFSPGGLAGALSGFLKDPRGSVGNTFGRLRRWAGRLRP